MSVGPSLMFAGSLLVFFAVVYSCFFFWNRLVANSEKNTEKSDVWSQAMIGSFLMCLLFAVCFAMGVWFSIARLKGDGWILSA